MTDFVADIAALDFTALDDALNRARTAIAKGKELSAGELNPTSLLGDLGGALTAAGQVHLDPSAVSGLGQAALDALGELVELPDLSGLAAVVGDLENLASRLTTIAEVFTGGGDGRAVLDRVLVQLSGSLDLTSFLREAVDDAVRALDVTIPPEYVRPLRSLAALAGNPSPAELLDILGSVITGLDIGGVGRLVVSTRAAVDAVAGAGDSGALDIALGSVTARLNVVYDLLEAAAIDVAAVEAAITDVGAAVDAAGQAALQFRSGLATDLRTAANALAELRLLPTLDGLVAQLPLPGEDLPRQLLESLEGMADSLEQLTPNAVDDALKAMKDEFITVMGLDKLAGLLAGLDEVFDEAGAQLDRLPLPALRDEAVAALVVTQQKVLAFDGFSFLDDAVAPVRELEHKLRTLDTNTVTDAAAALSAQVNGLLADVDLTPVHDAIAAIVGPLGQVIDQLVPFVQQVTDQLKTLVGEFDQIDFHAAGTQTLDLLHGIRTQVSDAVEGGDVPDAVKAAVAAAAAVLRELDLAAELRAPFGDAVARIDVGTLIQPINQIWQVAGDALKKASPAALIAELDPPFDQLIAAVDKLSLQPLIAALQRLFDDLVVSLSALDPRKLVAPLEAKFQELVHSVTAALDPAPLFAPLRAAYQALADLLAKLDVAALLHSVLGGLSDMPHQITAGVGAKLAASGRGAGLPVPAAGAGFQLGDVLRPLAMFIGEVRARLRALAAGTLGPVLAQLAGATRGLRALVDPDTGLAVQLADALDARLNWLDPQAGDGPLASLRRDLEALPLAVAGARVDAAAQARLTVAADGVQFSARIDLAADAEVPQHAARLRQTSDSAELGRSTRLLARALDAALPGELLTGALDPATATDAFLDAVFARIDPTPLADQLDALGARIEARFVALADHFALGLFRLVDALFTAVSPLMPDNVITRLQAGVDRVVARLHVLDPAPLEQEVRDLVKAAIDLLAVHSPATLAAELGAVFDACLDQLRALSPASLFGGIDPFAPVKTQLQTLRPSVVLAPLTDSTKQFDVALQTIANVDLTFVTGLVGELEQAFNDVLAGVEQEWNSLLDELAAVSGGASVSVG